MASGEKGVAVSNVFNGSVVEAGGVTVGTDWTTVAAGDVGHLAGVPVLNFTVHHATGGDLNGARLELLNQGGDPAADWHTLIDSEAGAGDEWQGDGVASLVFASDAIKGMVVGDRRSAIALLWAADQWRLALRAGTAATVNVFGGVRGV